MIKPLNTEERRFAAENHELVFAFLREKELPVSLYYDVVIFGYLKAVQKYCARKRKAGTAFPRLRGSGWKASFQNIRNI